MSRLICRLSPVAYVLDSDTTATSAIVVSAAVAFGASPSAAPAANSGSAPTPAASAAPGTNPGMSGGMPGGFPGGPGMFGSAGGAWMSPGGVAGGQGGPGGPSMMALGLSQITITGIDGSKLDLKTDDGWTRTVDATGVTIQRAGQTITVADLKVGDTIRLQEQRASDGTWSVTGIEVVLPTVDGTVAAVTGDSVTVTLPDGSTQKVATDASTTYFIGATAATASAVTVGVRVDIEATGSGSSLTAAVVRVAPAVLGGTVKSTSSDAITITQRDGTTATIHVDAATTYQVKGVTSAKFSDIAVGDQVFAQGTLRDDGSLDATSVTSGLPGMAGGGSSVGPGFGGPGFGGHGRPSWGGPGSNQGPSSSPVPTTDPGT